jgi:NADH dehydrogenase (ubiquinone) Fe-S protein 4
LVVPQFSRNFSEKKSLEQGRTETSLLETTADEIVEVSSISGLPSSQLGRKARIFKPAQHVMQSGSHNTLKWKLEFENQERWENPLMGWASSGDPLSNKTITFDSQEEAVAFALKNGWTYEVMEPQVPKIRIKSYGSNFSWDKKTRVTSK